MEEFYAAHEHIDIETPWFDEWYDAQEADENQWFACPPTPVAVSHMPSGGDVNACVPPTDDGSVAKANESQIIAGPVVPSLRGRLAKYLPVEPASPQPHDGVVLPVAQQKHAKKLDFLGDEKKHNKKKQKQDKELATQPVSLSAPACDGRVVIPAQKLLTSCDDEIKFAHRRVDIFGVYYKDHRLRVLRVLTLDNLNDSKQNNNATILVHASDLGCVVERKSNISRLFGKFESPKHKLLMNVVGAHNMVTGQESNVLTIDGIKRFLTTSRMKDYPEYSTWLRERLLPLLPRLNCDPLDLSTMMLQEGITILSTCGSPYGNDTRPNKKRKQKHEALLQGGGA